MDRNPGGCVGAPLSVPPLSVPLFVRVSSALCILGILLGGAVGWLAHALEPPVTQGSGARGGSGEGARGGIEVLQLSADIPGHCSNPRLSPSGDRVAFERRDEASRGRQVLLAPTVPTAAAAAGLEQAVALVPGSSASLLAAFNTKSLPVLRDFIWMPAGPLQHIHPYVVAGAEREDGASLYLAGLGRLTNERSIEGHPALSSDGSMLAFVSGRSGEGDLYALALTEPGRPLRRLTFSEHEAELFPVWHPSGERLFFVRHGASGDQIVMLEGMRRGPLKETVLTSGPATRTAPSCAPSGEWLAWYSSERQPDQLDLVVLSLRPGASREGRILLKHGVSAERHGPAWLPDSSGLIAVQSSAQAMDPLVKIRLKTGELTRIPTGTVHNREPEVGLKDGTPYLVFVAQGRSVAAAERSWQRVYGARLTSAGPP